MKKRLIFAIFTVICCLTLCLCACSLHTHKFSEMWTSDDTYHWHAAICKHDAEISGKSKHAYGEWETVTAPTEDSYGQKKRACVECGYLDTERIDKILHEHIFSEDWSVNESYHWHSAECVHAEEIADKDAHNFVDGVCGDCGYIQELIYAFNEETDSYYVSGVGKGAGEEITIPSFYLDKPVSGIANGAFRDSAFITYVNLPTSIKEIGDNAFEGLVYLENIKLPDSLKRIGAYAFYNCRALVSAVIPNSVERIGEGIFRACSELKELTIPFVGRSVNAGVASESSVLGYLFGKNMYAGGVAVEQNYSASGSVVYYIPEKLSKVTLTGGKIFYGAFSRCFSLKEVVIGNGVTEIGNMAFVDCISLAKVAIGSGVTRIGNFAFNFCSNLMSVTVGANVREIEPSAFDNCYKLVEIYNFSALEIVKGSDDNGKIAVNALDVYVSENAKSKIRNIDGGYTFYTSDDRSYIIGYVGTGDKLELNDKLGGVKYEVYKYAFYKNLTVKDVNIGGFVTAIGDRAFFGAENIETVNIDDAVENIGSWAFAYCVSLKKVTLPKNVVEIGDGAFSSCRELKSVAVPEGVAVIGDSAFWNCRALAEITLPKSLTSVEKDAFGECASLLKVYYAGDADAWADVDFRDGNENIISATVYFTSEESPTLEGISAL